MSQSHSRFLIVEDEDIAARKLKKLVAEIDPGLQCLGITDSIESTVNWLENTATYPDLILMDIELADGQSFEIFSRTEIACPVIFTTAYDEFALKAFKVNSVDYLLKPIKKEELAAALAKWKSQSAKPTDDSTNNNLEKLIGELIAKNPAEKYRTRFLVKQGQRLVPVNTDQIAYFYTEEKVVFIRTKNNQRFILNYILDDLEQMLDPAGFFRANRQFILSGTAVSEIQTWFNGKLKIAVNPASAEEIVISREKAADFRSWMGE